MAARGPAAAEVARIILDAVAVAHGLDHLEIEPRALVYALRLNRAAFASRCATHFVQLADDRVDGFRLAFRLDDVMALGINRQPRKLLLHGAEERIELGKAFNLIAEHFDAVRVLVVGREDSNTFDVLLTRYGCVLATFTSSSRKDRRWGLFWK